MPRSPTRLASDRPAAVLLLAAATALAPAQSAADPADGWRAGNPAIPEVKVGFLLHDFIRDNEDSQTLSLNLELLWSDLEYWAFDSEFVEVLLNPVPMIGGTVNTAGGVNTLYAGVAWPWAFDFGLTVTNSFAASLNDGRTERDTVACPAGLNPPCELPGNRAFVLTDEPILGSNILFRYGLDVAWQVDEVHSLSVYYSHASNAGLADDNDGLDFIGLRYGVRLGRLVD